jgi:cold shock CspA family protein
MPIAGAAMSANAAMAERYTGTIWTAFPERGFGFIRSDSKLSGFSDEFFLHKSEMDCPNKLRTGQRVSFAIGSRDGKPRAVDVRVIEQ